MDWDDVCIEYDELVAAGEINPEEESLDDYLEDYVGRMIDRADWDMGDR